MSEEKMTEIPITPLSVILMNGIASLVKVQKKAVEEGKDPLMLTDVEAFQAVTEGVIAAVKEIKYGLHALTPQQEKFLAVVEQAKADLEKSGQKDNLELKLIAVPKRNTAGLVDAQGQPLTKEKSIIIAK